MILLFLLSVFLISPEVSTYPGKHHVRVKIRKDPSVQDGIRVLIDGHGLTRQLKMVPLQNIWSRTAKFVTVGEDTDGKLALEKANSLPQNGKFYQDPDVGSFLEIRDGRIDGIVDHEWSIKSENDRRHSMHKRALNMKYERDYLEVPDDVKLNYTYADFARHAIYRDYLEVPDDVLESNDTYTYRRNIATRREIKSYTVEITVVVDSTLANEIGDDERVSNYLTIFWNGVNKRYAAMDDPLITINLVGAYIIRKPEEESFINSDGLDGGKINSSTLSSFSKWVYNHKDLLPNHDIAFLQTGRDMVKDDGITQLTGLAYRGASCKRLGGVSYGTAMGEDIGGYFHGVQVAAHEIAHNLGAPHDGEKNLGSENCPVSDGYIMSDEVGTPNQMFFSECSKNAIRDYLISYYGLPALCLKVDFSKLGLSNELPGNILNMDDQCKYITESETATVDASVTPQDTLCFNLVCKYNQSGHFYVIKTLLPAAEGSPCPAGGKCSDGKCV